MPDQLPGTIAYMSPEQLRGNPPEPGRDLWALAVRMTLAQKHLGKEDKPWEEFFARCLAADSRVRPDSAEDFFRHFETVVLARGPVD